jgi:hypothetical protein
VEDERYADFVGGVTLTGTVVRLDLVSLSTTEKDDKDQPRTVIRERVVMPVEGFVRSFAVMARVMEQLEKQGVIKRSAGSNLPSVPPGPPQSVNFT